MENIPDLNIPPSIHPELSCEIKKLLKLVDELVTPVGAEVSLELLYHWRCGSCQKWWTVADVVPTQKTVYCPHCMTPNRAPDSVPLGPGVKLPENLVWS